MKFQLYTCFNNGYPFQEGNFDRLIQLPPLPDERNALDAYMDIPHNFCIPDGKNTRLRDCVESREFERQTIDNNEGFVL